MHRICKLLSVFAAAILLSACGSGPGNESQTINYAALDSLQTERVLTIGESEDYLPGQLTGLKVTPDGGVLVGDWASNTIEQFDTEGRHIATVAKKGGGPGELRNYFRILDSGSDTLLIDQQSSQMDFFVPGDDGIYRFVRAETEAELPDRSFNIIGAHSDTAYYGTAVTMYSSAGANDAEKEDYSTNVLAVISNTGEILEDSVQTFKKSNAHVQRSENSIRVWGIPFRFDDELAILNDGSYLIARIDSNAIYHYNRDHSLKRKIPVMAEPRAVTSEDLDYKLENYDRKVRNEIEARITDQKPAYQNMWATSDYIWLLTEEGEEGKEMVVLDYGGNAMGKFMLPEVASIETVTGNRIYTVHRSPELGHQIRVYEVAVGA